MRFTFAGIILFFISGLLSAQSGKVISISDGDTFYILDSTNTRTKVRMYGIDAPEKGQDFYQRAKQHLSSLIAGKTVKCRYEGTDQYKRKLMTVFLLGENINETMVRNGYAWQYKYNRDKIYEKLQAEAKAKKRGLWVMPNPIDPWQFRKDQKEKRKQKNVNK